MEISFERGGTVSATVKGDLWGVSYAQVGGWHCEGSPKTFLAMFGLSFPTV